jgi:hypothetical protein
MKAFIENGVVKEVWENPERLFRPEYAALFIDCPPDVKSGWFYYNNGFHQSPQGMTRQEYQAIIEAKETETTTRKSAADFLAFLTPQELGQFIDLLQSAGVLTRERADQLRPPTKG